MVRDLLFLECNFNSKDMDVSIIIVNYKTSAYIVECVKSIIEKTHDLKYEVIILDNNSEPNFKEIISKAISSEHKDLFHFIPLKENKGFGRANNDGLKYASGRNILFLNPDTALVNNAVKILSDFLDNHPKAGACGANILNENLLPTHSFRRFLPGLLWEIDSFFSSVPQKLYYGKNYKYNHSHKPLEVAFITGADLMVKKDVLDITGAFYDEFFMYFEETDLCARIIKKGFKIFCVPNAFIQHLSNKSFVEIGVWQNETKTKLMEESRFIYYQRNVGPLERSACNAISRLYLSLRTILVRNKLKNDYYKLRKKYFLENLRRFR